MKEHEKVAKYSAIMLIAITAISNIRRFAGVAKHDMIQRAHLAISKKAAQKNV